MLKNAMLTKSGFLELHVHFNQSFQSVAFIR